MSPPFLLSSLLTFSCCLCRSQGVHTSYYRLGELETLVAARRSARELEAASKKGEAIEMTPAGAEGAKGEAAPTAGDVKLDEK